MVIRCGAITAVLSICVICNVKFRGKKKDPTELLINCDAKWCILYSLRGLKLSFLMSAKRYYAAFFNFRSRTDRTNEAGGGQAPNPNFPRGMYSEIRANKCGCPCILKSSSSNQPGGTRDGTRLICILWWEHQWGLVNSLQNKHKQPSLSGKAAKTAYLYLGRVEPRLKSRKVFFVFSFFISARQITATAQVWVVCMCVLVDIVCSCRCLHGWWLLIMLTIHKGMKSCF